MQTQVENVFHLCLGNLIAWMSYYLSCLRDLYVPPTEFIPIYMIYTAPGNSLFAFEPKACHRTELKH
jgi:hypothetical protein